MQIAPLERVIVKSVMDVARKLGWWCAKNHGSAYSLAGLPDVIAIKNGRAVWMEVKRPGGKPTPVQVRVMAQLMAAGCECSVVRSAEDARQFLGRL